jgi:hypothetical protein
VSICSRDGHLALLVVTLKLFKFIYFNSFFKILLGLFGLNKNDISDPALNYAGISVAIIGLIVYLQVETKASPDKREADDVHERLILSDDAVLRAQDKKERQVSTGSQGLYSPAVEQQQSVFGSDWNPVTKRVVGVTMAFAAGILFGTSFNPAQYVIDNKKDGDDNGLNYVFPHFCGIICSSWMYMVLYFVYKYWKNQQAYVNPDCILPATVSGIMWGVAEIAWFVANGELGFSVSFPVIASGPGFLGALWGIFLFKEISGTRNFLTLGVAFLISASAAVMVATAH